MGGDKAMTSYLQLLARAACEKVWQNRDTKGCETCAYSFGGEDDPQCTIIEVTNDYQKCPAIPHGKQEWMPDRKEE